MAARVWAGDRPSAAARWSPAQMRCFRSATRTMKNSSRFELKMDRNLTRSRSGTVGSWASSSTRRLNSSHDSSRLIMRSDMASALVSERLAKQQRVAHALFADGQAVIPAEHHELLDHDRAGHDDVRPLGPEPGHLAALAERQRLQPSPDSRDVRLLKSESVTRSVLLAPGGEVDAAQRPNSPPEGDDLLASLGLRERLDEPVSYLRAKIASLPRGGRG